LFLYFTESFTSIYTITPGEPGIIPIVKRKHQFSAIISLADNPFNASRSARQGQILKSRKGTGLQQKRHFALAFAGFHLALGVVIILGANTKDYDYDSEDRETSVDFAPFIQYYFGGKKVKPFMSASGGIGRYKNTYIASSPKYNNESTSTILTYSLGAGVGFFLNDMLSIDLELGYGRISSKINKDFKGIQNAFGLNAGFSFFF